MVNATPGIQFALRLGFLVAGLVLGAAALAAPPAVTLREVAGGFTNPLEIAHAGDGSGRLFVVEKGGPVRIVKNGAVRATPFLDASSLISTSGERGLLGLAFHPQYSANRKFYIFYTRSSDGAIVVSEFLTSLADADLADPASARIVITIPHPGADNHNGGRIAFGPDGYLYIGTGDGGGGGDPDGNAQNRTKLLGKLLRISVDGGTGYAIPPGNPFAGSTCAAGACPEIWAYGLRNPWKFSFDRLTGDLFIGDVGQGLWEEIDFEPAGDAGGRNYGWRIFEGTHCFNPSSGCALSGHVPPVLEYGHNAQGGNSVTGGYRYRGKRSRSLRGFYLYGDFISNRVWAAEFNGAWSTSVLIEPPSVLSNISSFGEDEAGEIHVASYSTGRIYAIDGPGPRIDTRSDFNGNGKSDILWRHSNGINYVWQVNGAAISGGVVPIPSQGVLPSVTDPDWTIAGVGDFNGDGKADILWRHTNGTNYVWHLDGSTINGGVLTISSQGLLPRVPAPEWAVAGIGDFNGDGKADILWRRNDGTNYVWHIDGATINGGVLAISSQGLLPGVPAPEWAVAGIGDFNGDGKADILWRRNDGTNYVWHVNGAAILGGVLAIASQGLLPGVDTSWSVVGTGDYNGDGMSDVLWRRNDGTNYVWHVNGTTINGGVLAIGSQGLLPSVTDTSWSVVGAGDYNGDGKSDVLWRHTNGTNYVWHVDGAVINGGMLSIPSQGLLPGVTDAGWQVQNPK